MSTINILLVDDHHMIRQGLKAFLDKESFNIVAEASNGKEALNLLNTHKVSVLVTDIMMPDMDGIELCKQVKQAYPHINVLALTMLDEGHNIKKMLNAGAKGYILKDCTQDELREAIETVNQGTNYFSKEVTNIIMQGLTAEPSPKKRLVAEVPISKREMEVLHLICNEQSNQEIANQLFISPRTVEVHKRNLIEKTGCKNSTGLVLYAIERKLFDDL